MRNENEQHGQQIQLKITKLCTVCLCAVVRNQDDLRPGNKAGRLQQPPCCSKAKKGNSFSWRACMLDSLHRSGSSLLDHLQQSSTGCIILQISKTGLCARNIFWLSCEKDQATTIWSLDWSHAKIICLWELLPNKMSCLSLIQSYLKVCSQGIWPLNKGQSMQQLGESLINSCGFVSSVAWGFLLALFVTDSQPISP